MGSIPVQRSSRWQPVAFARRLLADARASRAALLGLFSMALLPLSVRVLLLAENGQPLYAFDLVGAIGDMMLGLLAATTLLALRRSSLLLFLVAASAWLVLNFAYYEFVREYGSPYMMIHSSFLFDRDFVVGSGIRFSHPYLMGLAWLGLVLFGFLAGRSLRPGRRALVTVLVIYAVVLTVPPLRENASPWRQRDFVANNAADIVNRILWPDGLREQLEAGAPLLEDYLAPDLSGRPFLSAARPLPNVVLVIIEGIAGANLPVLAEAHGLSHELRMPRLDALARENLSYSTFITHQKQSNRGLYAALCGDLPRLMAGLPKMTAIADGAERDCLPRHLATAGYDTLFLNSAHNAFMYMGSFMRKIGFQRALGLENFGDKLWRGPWGVDDKSLYRIALDQIAALRRRSRPYFVSIYTSTTHHPFETPESTLSGHEARDHAWKFADDAVADFVAEMRRRGQLEDTLVLITSDEASFSGEPHRDKHGTLAAYTENWGFMVALSPERRRARIDAAYQQADIPLSVLDYLGLDPDDAFIGRSLFRAYDRPHSIFSANVYKGLIHEYAEGKSLTVCTEALRDCERFLTQGRPLFAFHHDEVKGGIEPTPLMSAVRAYSVLGARPYGATKPPELAAH